MPATDAMSKTIDSRTSQKGTLETSKRVIMFIGEVSGKSDTIVAKVESGTSAIRKFNM